MFLFKVVVFLARSCFVRICQCFAENFFSRAGKEDSSTEDTKTEDTNMSVKEQEDASYVVKYQVYYLSPSNGLVSDFPLIS